MKAFFTKISSWFENYQERKKKERQEQERQMTKRMFNVKESNGALYVICEGSAVKKIEDGKTATEIVEMIQEARLAHLSYNNISAENDPE
jgi:hypothetical protein